MVGHFVVIGMVGSAGLAVALLVTLMLWRAPAPIERSGAAERAEVEYVSKAFRGHTPTRRIIATALTDRSGAVELDFQVLDSGGRQIEQDLRVQALLIQSGHPVLPEPMVIERTAPGVYRAVGQATSEGTWQIRIVLPDGSLETRLSIDRP